MAKFTIITPVYNGAEYIEETVSSVIAAADSFDYEYLVVDDGSNDQTRKLLEKYITKIRYMYQENSGQAAAINNAIQIASGDYMTIVNADDPLITGQLFQDAEKIMDHNPKIVATYPDWNMIDSSGKISEIIKVKDFEVIELVGKFNCLVGPGGVFRTEVAKKINGWDPSYRFVPDYDFWLRLSEFGSFEHIPEIQASWRTHESSISIASRSQEMANERIRVIRMYLERNPETPEKIKRMALGHSHYRAAVLSFFDSRIHGRKLLLTGIKKYPRILIEKDIRVTLFVLFSPASGILMRSLMHIEYFRNMAEKLRRNIKS